MTFPRISAFPKCYIDQIAIHKTMTVFEWIQMAQDLKSVMGQDSADKRKMERS